ncbi:diguanylate cyclase [Leptolyngbya sp. AN02str]|uniref:sensor domain-containing diguanylate cyclase n=1 Tax=Leptolyngbya sp. AN02str TaxID=3423363 RepID=UPI003D31D6E9
MAGSEVLGTQFTTLSENVNAIWFPDAIALAATLIWGPQIWFGILLGSLGAGLMSFSLSPLMVACLIFFAIGNVFTAIASAALIQTTTGTRYPFLKATHVLVFIAFGVCLNQLFNAMIDTSFLSLASVMTWSNAGILTRWISGSVGSLIATPLLLTCYFRIYGPLKYGQPPKLQPISWEPIVWISLLFVVSKLVFFHQVSIEYLILALLVWSAFRFSRFFTKLTIVIVSLGAVIGTSQGQSAFTEADPVQSVLFLGSFISTISITPLFLMSLLEERFQSVKALEQTNQELEIQVIQRTRALSAANAQLRKTSGTDSLTQCFNRLKIDEILDYNLTLHHRYEQRFSVILFDLDHFKAVNNHYGHVIGNTLLIEVVRLCQSCLRSTDVLGRWGGEEFIVICPNTNLTDANNLAERLRKTLAARYFEPVGYTTASFGIAECDSHHALPKDLIRHADTALRKAKAKGRNCTVAHQGLTDSANGQSR